MMSAATARAAGAALAQRVPAFSVRLPASPRERRIRALRDGLSIAGLFVLAWFIIRWYPWWFGYDAHAYWGVNPLSPYHFDGTPDQFGAFRYSPAAAQVAALFSLLPWPVFATCWIGVLAVAVAWIGGEWSLAILAFVPVVWDGYLGNIEILLAAAILAGFRWPAAWSFVLLTKITPGVGLLWFVVRREWRALGTALAATAAIAGASFVFTPSAWIAWPNSLAEVGGRPDLPFMAARMVAAAALVVWGAKTDRPWTVIVAGTIALAWLDPKTTAMLIGLAAFLPPVGARARRAVGHLVGAGAPEIVATIGPAAEEEPPVPGWVSWPQQGAGAT